MLRDFKAPGMTVEIDNYDDSWEEGEQKKESFQDVLLPTKCAENIRFLTDTICPQMDSTCFGIFLKYV